VLHVGLWDRPVLEPRRPLDVAVWTFWLARRARYQRERALLPPGVELIELGPAGRPSVRFGDFSRSAELVAAGYDAALATLAGP
jgi:hypothetical protein